MKRCLVISYGPIPTPKYQKIEGGGMRAWGLAQGLSKRGYDVTVGVNQSFPLDIMTQDGISLINWAEDQSFDEILQSYDAVVINYSMGGPMSYVVDHIPDHTTLVLDCYVPIYIEVSARNAADMSTEYKNYQVDLTHWNKALARGDYFLCANEPQKHMYMGALGALGILNPYSYKTERVLVVPFGVEESIDVSSSYNPYTNLGVKDDDFVLLWFGGLYPWFNIKPLRDAVSRLSETHSSFHFVIVGGKNPYNQNPDFQKQYDETFAYFKKTDLIDRVVHFVDWVDFNDRINWYTNASVVISINNVGEENIYSWRTRVMDFVWGEIPMLTNGGDPLSESLIEADAAIRLTDTTEPTIFNTISGLIDHTGKLKEVHSNLLGQKTRYYWTNVVEPIAEALTYDKHPYLEEKTFRIDNSLNQSNSADLSTTQKSKIKKLLRAPRKAAGIVRRKGVKRSLLLASSTLTNRTKKSTVRRAARQYYFFSHPIDYTGAPLVLIDILKDFSEKINSKDINLLYPGGEKDLISSIRKLGITLDKAVLGIGSRMIHAQLGIRPNDFVLLNTIAIYPNYRDYIFGLLESGKLHEATWFIHEDKPEMRFEQNKGLESRIEKLIKADKLKVYVPSSQTAKEYNEYFHTTKVKPVTLRVTVPQRYKNKRTADDFSNLRFMLSGTSTDGRKGQLLTVAALAKVKSDYIDKNPQHYRNFSLTLLAVGAGDYVSDQVRSIGKGLLGDRVSFYKTQPKDKAMEITNQCNVTICSSLNETFGLFAAEGMLMGHVLIRNYASGHHEQIIDGRNGYLVDTNNIDEFTSALEKLLNKKMSNGELLKMSTVSKEIAIQFENANYYDQICG